MHCRELVPFDMMKEDPYLVAALEYLLKESTGTKISIKQHITYVCTDSQ